MAPADRHGPTPSLPLTRPLLAAFTSILLAACTVGTEVPPTPAADAKPATVISTTGEIPVGNASLAFVRTGPDDPVLTLVAVHGGPGMNSDYLRDLDRLAQDGYDVIRYDQRGSGGSGMPSASLSLAAHIQDLGVVLASVGTPPVVLFGHSWGGLLSLAYTAANPGQVAAVVLFGSAPPTRSALRAASFQFEGRIAQGQRQGWIATDLPPEPTSLTSILPAYFSDPAFQPPADLRSIQVSPRVNAGTWDALGDYDLRQDLASIEVPVLFFYGTDDPFGRTMAEATLEALTGTEPEVHWLASCGHFWQECPDQFMPPLRAFLTRIARR